MHIFYDPLIDFNSSSAQHVLDPEESWHCVKVLRLTAGTNIQLVNGRGGFYNAAISRADPKATVLKLLNEVEGFNRRNHYLHIAVAPTKNIERLEWFLEKATEIGIDEISPVICERSERKEIKTERLHKVMVAAMKQSLKAWLPKLNEARKFDQFTRGARDGEQLFIAHCAQGDRSQLAAHVNLGQRYTVLVGPEGDFTPAEIEKAARAGYIPVTLGDSRLRTETAALEACFEINYLNRATNTL